MEKRTVWDLITIAGLDFRQLSIRYSRSCWDAWKLLKSNDLRNLDNPFCSGPQTLLEAKVTEVKGIKGSIPITRLTRIRLQDLAPEGIQTIERVYGKKFGHLVGKVKPGQDVVHQEFVDTFEEDIANDPKHLANNHVAAAAVVDTVFSFLAEEHTTAPELASVIEDILDHASKHPERQRQISLAVRSAWIGRACQDQSWKASADFHFFSKLKPNTSAIDEYVAKPVLQYLLQDLRDNFGVRD